MRWMILAGLAACATAGRDNPNQGQVDAPLGRNPDGSTIDTSGMIDSGGGGGHVTLTQTPGASFDQAHTPTCVNRASGSETKENSWFRVFPLADHGISGTFHVTQVSFGVIEAAGNPNVQVKLGTYSGTPGDTLTTGQITPIGATMVAVPDSGATQWVSAPLSADVAAGSTLVVELYTLRSRRIRQGAVLWWNTRQRDPDWLHAGAVLPGRFAACGHHDRHVRRSTLADHRHRRLVRIPTKQPAKPTASLR